MKLSVLIVLLCLPLVTFAQNYQGISEQDMQKMLQQAQQMETCMRNIDQQKLNALDQQSKQVESEIKSLCAKGKRADAQKKADGFGEQMATDPTIQAMMKCGDMMKGLPFMEQLFDDDSSIHVCDELQ